MNSLLENSARSRFGAGIKLPIDVPVDGFLNLGHDKVQIAQNNIDEKQAISFIQRELSNEKVAIVSECLYYFCKSIHQTKAPTTSPIVDDAASRVCNIALSGSPDNTGSDEIIPARRLVYKELYAGTHFEDVEIGLSNDSKGSITLRSPEQDTSDFVHYLGPTMLVISPHSTTTVKFRVVRPNFGKRVQTETKKFHYTAGGGDVSIVFAVARNKPPQMPQNCDAVGAGGACIRCTAVVTAEQQFKIGDKLPLFCPDMAPGELQVTWNMVTDITPRCPSAECGGIFGTIEIVTPSGKQAIPYGLKEWFGFPRQIKGIGSVRSEKRGNLNIDIEVSDIYSNPPPGSPIRDHFVFVAPVTITVANMSVPIDAELH